MRHHNILETDMLVWLGSLLLICKEANCDATVPAASPAPANRYN
jgi:hypothetical protein